jgi:CheY-like chemotaxis protein
LRVLVVDDDTSTREAIAEVLERAGADVTLAGSAKEARRVVDGRAPELIICDIAMPGEDGYSFIRHLRSCGVSGLGVVPALALTAMARAEDREEALAAGFQMHLSKPVDVGRLTAAVLELAASRSV